MEMDLDSLPEEVRARVVALTAEVLPAVPRLPVPVRRIAGFAPHRRAGLGGAAIGEALTDDDFRERVGVQVAARPTPDRSGPAVLAARAWLARPEGWAAEVQTLLAALPASAEPSAEVREIEQLRARLADAEQGARDLRADHRAQLAEQKAERTSLRRKLGDARTALRQARADAEDATAAAMGARGDADARTAELEKENRRLRARVEQLESLEARRRGDEREERQAATVRARLLLDTVIDAAAGLRRELALPTVEGVPADRVGADVAAAGSRTPSSAGALAAASPALLEQLLAMPRSRLIIDGYNVSKSAWASSPLEAQRLRLVSALAALVARTGAETTVVFDAAETEHRPPVTAPRGVRVLYSPLGVIADDVIRDLVAVEPQGRVIAVVTRDRALGADVARAGARVVDPQALLTLVTR